MSDFEALHRMVWETRAWLHERWPTPDQLDSARFAVTEGAEALDAFLRAKGGYARNNSKDLSVNAELAQAVMMLLTVMGPEYHGSDLVLAEGDVDIDDCVMAIHNVYIDVKMLGGELWSSMGLALQIIDRYVPDLASQLADMLNRIEAKHGLSSMKTPT